MKCSKVDLNSSIECGGLELMKEIRVEITI